jgi:hypothetical protein
MSEKQRTRRNILEKERDTQRERKREKERERERDSETKRKRRLEYSDRSVIVEEETCLEKQDDLSL